MRNIPINEAETVLEPFWDGGSSEHPTDKLSLLDQYEVSIPQNTVASIQQIWCALQIRFGSGPAGAVVSMERACDVDIAGYDIFRIFASIPSHVRISAEATIDGKHADILPETCGYDTNGEIDGRLSGKRLTGLKVSYRFTENRPVSMQVLWFGLANSAKQRDMEKATAPYSPEWEGCIRGDAEAYPRVPELEILLESSELEELRESLHSGDLAESYRTFLESAESYLTWEPELDIGKYIPKPDRRWVRDRDMERRSTAGIMEVLAFAGMIEGNYEMARMACRMALSACHCEYWCESVVGTMPGTTWHHRSFTEEIYCRACALVLDWAGWALTDHAKQLIRDAIAMKGLPRIESDFKRMEYIRYMNQGIVFSSGRIFGTIALAAAFPRYESSIIEAEKDLHEMIDNYVQADGGTLEGMAYWAYTFSQVMPVFAALAKHHGKSLSEYSTSTLKKTADFGLGMLSTGGNSSSYLAINDAHQDSSYPPGLTAAYARLTGSSAWNDLYEKSEIPARPDLYHLILAPRHAVPAEDRSPERFSCFPDVGQVSSVRLLDSGDVSHFHFCSGPTDSGHFHQDKGSFVLEAGGEALAIDRGVTNYDHPETGLMAIPRRHNLVYPVPGSGGYAVQGHDMPGGRLTWSSFQSEVLLLCSDNAKAWSGGLFAVNYRRVISPAPDLFIIDDQLELSEGMPVVFAANSTCPIERTNAGARIVGAEYQVDFVPVGWRPDTIETVEDGVDSHLHPVEVLRITSGTAKQHRLTTAVVVSRKDSGPRWSVSGNSVRDVTGSREIALRCQDGTIEAEIRGAGSDTMYLMGRGDTWESGRQ